MSYFNPSYAQSDRMKGKLKHRIEIERGGVTITQDEKGKGFFVDIKGYTRLAVTATELDNFREALGSYTLQTEIRKQMKGEV